MQHRNHCAPLWKKCRQKWRVLKSIRFRLWCKHRIRVVLKTVNGFFISYRNKRHIYLWKHSLQIPSENSLKTATYSLLSRTEGHGSRGFTQCSQVCLLNFLFLLSSYNVGYCCLVNTSLLHHCESGQSVKNRNVKKPGKAKLRGRSLG